MCLHVFQFSCFYSDSHYRLISECHKSTSVRYQHVQFITNNVVVQRRARGGECSTETGKCTAGSCSCVRGTFTAAGQNQLFLGAKLLYESICPTASRQSVKTVLLLSLFWRLPLSQFISVPVYSIYVYIFILITLFIFLS